MSLQIFFSYPKKKTIIYKTKGLVYPLCPVEGDMLTNMSGFFFFLLQVKPFNFVFSLKPFLAGSNDLWSFQNHQSAPKFNLFEVSGKQVTE